MEIIQKSPEGLQIEVGENKFTIIEVPALERSFIFEREKRLARPFVKELLKDEKEILETEEFDVIGFCKSWWQGECDVLQSQIDLGVDSLTPAQLKQFESRLKQNLACFENPNTKWETLYAQKNSNKKSPQNLYEKEFTEMVGIYGLLGTYCHFLRDEKGNAIFNAKELVFSPEKINLMNLLKIDTDFYATVKNVVDKGLGFMKEEQKKKENPIGETK